MEKKLYKSTNKMISGVCAGIAEYFGADPTIIRLIWALVTFFSAIFIGTVVYIICAIVIPVKTVNDIDVDGLKRANAD